MYFGTVRFLLEDPACAGGDHSHTTSVWTKASGRTYGTCHSLLSKFLLLLPVQCLYCEEHVYIYVCLCTNCI